MRWWVFLLPAIAFGGTSEYKPDFRVERSSVAGGAELLTVFGRIPGAADEAGDVPFISVLRDTLGDGSGDNDRLRYVWILSCARPSLLQKAAASLPFFYWRPDLGKNADRTPKAVIDLGATSRDIWGGLAGTLAQTMALDPNGALIRSSTRSYRNNTSDHRRLQLLEGLAVMSQLEDIPEVSAMLNEPELLEMEARLTLAGRTFGGMVGAQKLPEAYIKQRTRTQEMRGHNWELLRQRAEANGLYFEPFGRNASATHALLWIATEDIGTVHRFDGQFLGIGDPYRDSRLRNWTGYRQVRDGREMIPLALYGLEYPKVPLLLVDFRDTRSPKRHEMMRRAATDTVSGVLGISRWGNWPFLAGSWTFNFVRARHGAANDRPSRLKAYSQVRQWLALDPDIDNGLRLVLQKRLEALGVNPLEDSVFKQANIARRQYAALLRYADDPQGLAARLQRDRNSELIAFRHSLGARMGLRMASFATLGAYTHHEETGETLELQLAQERQVARQLRFLERVAQSGPQTEVVWNMDEVRRVLDQIASSRIPERSAQLVQKILNQTSDEETRALCQRALLSLDTGGGQ
jgi:hypothetical protein